MLSKLCWVAKRKRKLILKLPTSEIISMQWDNYSEVYQLNITWPIYKNLSSNMRKISLMEQLWLKAMSTKEYF